jgi:acyl-CoA synthetase (AMP-forming)/AMP-acid ligase II
MSGYFAAPEATAEALRDGWLQTGDLGYRVGQNIFITGRAKDVIIKAGRNYIPEHFEQAAATVSGIRKNAVAAFGVPAPDKGTENIVVMAETTLRSRQEQEDLVRQVRRSISAHLELMPDDVVLVAPRTIPKTTSGKIRRPLCRQLYLDSR